MLNISEMAKYSYSCNKMQMGNYTQAFKYSMTLSDPNPDFMSFNVK